MTRVIGLRLRLAIVSASATNITECRLRFVGIDQDVSACE